MNLQVNHAFKKVYGDDTRMFEAKLSQFLDGANVLTVCNATTAILGIMSALGITDGEIVTTPLSWAGTLSGPLMLRNSIVLADITELDLNLDPSTIENLITPNTKCILSSDFLGVPCQLDAIRSICDKHGILLVHDAATSFGSWYKGHYSGYYADVCVHSFGRNKSFTTGEGGCVSTHSDSLYEKLLSVLAHPERQRFQLDTENIFSMNTAMHPLAVQFGLETFEYQVTQIATHRETVATRIADLGYASLYGAEVMPNYYKPFFNKQRFPTISNDWSALPYEYIGVGIDISRKYYVANDLCSHHNFNN